MTLRRIAILTVLTLVCAAGLGVAAKKKGQLSGPRLYVFDCGQLKFDSIANFGLAEDKTDIRRFAVPCYMIEHPAGRLLWDGGLPPNVADEEGWRGEGGMQFRLDRTLVEQLADLKLDLGSFDRIGFSHMHFDHVGVANGLTSGTILIQRFEYEAAFADEVTVPGFDPGLYGGLSVLEFQILDGEHDVFGDGKVRIVPAPGHTQGHQVLLVDLKKTGPVLLAGDLYHFPFSREERFVPAFNLDADTTRASMERIERLIEETGAKVWYAHDLATFESLKKSPEFYD